MMAVVAATVQKEVREALRDRRTLVLTILMPLIFYPALLGLTGWMGGQQQMKEGRRELVVGVSGMQEGIPSLAGEGIRWQTGGEEQVTTSLSSGMMDGWVSFGSLDENGKRAVTVHYLGTAQGEMAKLRVLKALRQFKEDWVKVRLDELGLSESVVEPIVVQTEDHASIRESSGSLYGGIAAYFLVFLSFTGCMAVAIDTAAGEKERGTLEAVLVTPASFTAVAGGKLIYIVIMGVISVLATTGGIGLLMLIGAAATGMLNAVSLFSLAAGAVLLLFTVVFFASLLFGLSIMANSSKEAHLRAAMLMLVIAMLLIYSTLPGVSGDGGVLWVPVLNVAMALRGLWEGSLDVTSYLAVFAETCLMAFCVLIWVSSRVRKNPEKVLLK